MATFKRGDRVLCINTEGFTSNSEIDLWQYPFLLHKYTIDFVYPDGTVTLVEVNLNAVNLDLINRADTPEAAFYPWHFVKIPEPLEEVIHHQKECEVEL